MALGAAAPQQHNNGIMGSTLGAVVVVGMFLGAIRVIYVGLEHGLNRRRIRRPFSKVGEPGFYEGDAAAKYGLFVVVGGLLLLGALLASTIHGFRQ